MNEVKTYWTSPLFNENEKIVTMITFKCTKCGETMEAPESLAGKTLQCPKCGLHESVPNIQKTHKDDILFNPNPTSSKPTT